MNPTELFKPNIKVLPLIIKQLLTKKFNKQNNQKVCISFYQTDDSAFEKFYKPILKPIDFNE